MADLGSQASERCTVYYARVSGHDRKADLARQAQRFQSHAEEKGYSRLEVIEGLGSGLSYR